MIVVVLNNIRSMENVGSIFRTSDAFGVGKIYLVGITPAPTDRFNRPNTKLTKSSLGAENSVSWEKVNDFNILNKKLKEEGFKIIAVEQSPKSINYKNLKTSKLLAPSSKLALVFGNEVDGLSESDLKLCDLVAEIPMKGVKESLNVSVSVGVVLSSLL